MSMQKQKYVFLFGAGAEGEGQLGITSGNNFKTAILTAKGIGIAANKIMNYNNDPNFEINNNMIISPNGVSALYQTMKETDNITMLFPKQKDRIIAEKYEQYRHNPSKSSVDQKRIKKSFEEIYKNNFYKPIVEGSTKRKEEVNLFLKRPCYYSYLDSMFNYLRIPEKYGGECTKVMKVYYAAFFSILNSIHEFLKKDIDPEDETIYQTIIGKAELDESRRKIAKLIEHLQKQVAKKAIEENSSQLYYTKMRELNAVCPIGCITTNYTNFGEKITKIKEKQISYLHGKLELFEDIKYKRIKQIDTFRDNEVIFPYMLIPSGIKPIISQYQIKEFYKARTMIDQADKVFIIGYGVNSDDEHITNLLRWKLDSGGIIDYFMFAKNDTEFDEKETEIREQFEDSSNITFYDCNDFCKVIDGLIEENKDR